MYRKINMANRVYKYFEVTLKKIEQTMNVNRKAEMKSQKDIKKLNTKNLLL